MPHDHAYTQLPDEPELRVKTLETLLTAKGLIDPAALDAIIETYTHKVGPQNGAQVVARAWSEPKFKSWLFADATAAVADMGFTGRQGEHVRIVENTPETHHLIVCTLCSCYPWSLLGIPPGWYKSDAYRARSVREPRKVLKEFGVTLLPRQQVQVWDSTSELRYLVLPMRPENTDHLDQSALAKLVTRDSMIGAGLPKAKADV